MIKPQLTWLAIGPFEWLASFVAIFRAMSMMPFEVIPFAIALPGTAMLPLGVPQSARDGVLLIRFAAHIGERAWTVIGEN